MIVEDEPYIYTLVSKSKPEDIVDMKDGWIYGGQEKDVADVKLDSSHQVISSEEDRICDVLAHNLQTHCVCMCECLCVCINIEVKARACM